MGRLFQVLVPLVLLTAAIAGCIGGDEDPQINGNDNGNEEPVNGNETANETAPPPVPKANIAVQMAIVGNASTDPPFVAPPGSDLEFTLDGSGSNVEEGSIEIYAWSVTLPDGSTIDAPGQRDSEFSFLVNSTSTHHYGVYTATLRVMSDQNQLDTTTAQFVLNYNNTYTFSGTMVGPAISGCDFPYQSKGEGPIPLPAGPSISEGTYRTHNFGTNSNVTNVDISMTFDSLDDASVKIYLHEGRADDAIEDGNCGDAIAESEEGSDTVTLSHDLPGAGTYSFRVQVIGLTLGDYTIELDVNYAIPGGAADDGGDDGDDGNDGEDNGDE